VRAERFDWERIVRRAPMSPRAKFLALVLATYASTDGRHVRPGVDRLAAVTGYEERSVRRALAELREDLRLIRRVSSGSSAGRRALTDEYELWIPEDLLERVELLSVAESPAPDRRTPESGDEAENTGHPSPVAVDNQGQISGHPSPVMDRNTGHPRPDHRTSVQEHRTPVTGTPDTHVPPPQQDQPQTTTRPPTGHLNETTHVARPPVDNHNCIDGVIWLGDEHGFGYCPTCRPAHDELHDTDEGALL
jgi:hypothetical protein